MKIAIVGAGGLVGNEFSRQLSTNHDVLAFRHSDLDITDTEAVSRVILSERPELIINCAVLGVDACEFDPSLAWAVNVAGAENLAKAADGVDAELVHLSSNYVFDGERTKDSPYSCEDDPAPINQYGLTKLAGECAVNAATRRCFVIRTSWVFGAGKDSFLGAVPRRLRTGQKIRAITDVWANSTYVRDIVPRVMEIVSLRHYATYHVVNSGLCSYYEFALEAARILGISVPKSVTLIEPVELDDLRLEARRPLHTSLSCRVSKDVGLAPLRHWRVALAEYVRTGC